MKFLTGLVGETMAHYLMQRNYPPQSLFHTLVDGPVGDPAHDPLPISRRALLCNRWPVMRTFFERILQKLVRRDEFRDMTLTPWRKLLHRRRRRSWHHIFSTLRRLRLQMAI